MTFLFNKKTHRAMHFLYKNSGTLPVHSSIKKANKNHVSNIINSNYYSERPYLYSSSKGRLNLRDRLNLKTKLNLKGSLTIEAAIGFPIFIIVVFAVISFISAMYIQLSMQIALEETVRGASKTAYISSIYANLSKEEKNTLENSSNSMVKTFGTSLLSASYLHKSFINEENKKLLNSPLIKNGEKGISFLASSIDLDEGIADVIINYQINLPFIPENFFHLNMTNRCYVHLYTGKELAQKQSQVDTYVYYTTYGKVFHFNRYCQHLLNYTEAVRYTKRSPVLNSCLQCVDKTSDLLRKEDPIVYVTKTKYCYHLSLNCPSFTGNIFRIKYSSLKKDDKICEKCLEGK